MKLKLKIYFSDDNHSEGFVKVISPQAQSDSMLLEFFPMIILKKPLIPQ